MFEVTTPLPIWCLLSGRKHSGAFFLAAFKTLLVDA